MDRAATSDQGRRAIGPFSVSAIGLGCMSLSHGYGPRTATEDAGRLLNAALDLGYDHLDTAALYGFGHNEQLLGATVMHRRAEFMLASKCGLVRGPDGKRLVDGSPAAIRATCEASLKNLRTEVIDLYYLHRIDPKVPIEESIGAIAGLVAQGKVRSIGVSEISAADIRRAHGVHPLAAVQTEYSLWTRNPEIAVLEACRELGITFVAFSPLARAFLTGKLRDVSGLADDDLRRTMPRFAPENYARNLVLLDGFATLAAETGCTMAQLALAWTTNRDQTLVAIPGTTRPDHLAENFDANGLVLDADVMARAETLINRHSVVGARYSAAAQADVTTEEFD